MFPNRFRHPNSPCRVKLQASPPIPNLEKYAFTWEITNICAFPLPEIRASNKSWPSTKSSADQMNSYRTRFTSLFVRVSSLAWRKSLIGSKLLTMNLEVENGNRVSRLNGEIRKYFVGSDYQFVRVLQTCRNKFIYQISGLWNLDELDWMYSMWYKFGFEMHSVVSNTNCVKGVTGKQHASSVLKIQMIIHSHTGYLVPVRVYFSNSLNQIHLVYKFIPNVTTTWLIVSHGCHFGGTWD